MDTPCNPQLEDGYTRIANELLDAIIRARLSRRQYSVLLAVIRKTYGYNRKTTPISIRQIATMTGLDRANVIRTIRELVKMAVLVRNEMPVSRDGAQVFEMGLNKHYGQWHLPGCIRTRADSKTGAKMTPSMTPPSLPDGCQNDTRPPSSQTGAKTTPPPFGECQIDTRLPAPQAGVRTAPPHQMDAQPSNKRHSDTRPSSEEPSEAPNGCQNDTRLPLSQPSAKTTPPPFGECQIDTRLPPLADGCQIGTRNGCQNNTPPGVKLTPPTVKDKKIKDNTKTTPPLSATQTSPPLRRGEEQGAATQPATDLQPECGLTTGNRGIGDLHRKSQTAFRIKTPDSHGVGFPGSTPNSTSTVDSRMGADTPVDHGTETSTDVSTNRAQDPAMENASADFALSFPETAPRREPRRHRAKPGDERFDRFWAAYPRKRSKLQAHKAFEHLAPDDELLGAVLESLERAKKSHDWRKENGRYIPYPATWLRAQGWLDEFALEAYTVTQLAVLDQYNTLMGEAGWPLAVLVPYSATRASNIDDFLGFSSKPDMPDHYFRYCARELAPHDGCGFDWLIRQNIFLRIREGVIAKRETRTLQWA